MPLYKYLCGICGHIQSDLRSIEDRNNIAICEICGCVSKKTITTPNLITDTNFAYTGKVDGRFGKRPIEGRQDFWQRAREKGLRETDKSEGMVTPITMEERVAKLKNI